MKYFITFLFFILTNCLVPSTISATINAKNNVSNSRIILKKKLNSTKLLSFKVLKNSFLSSKNKNLVYSILLMVLGLLLLVTSAPLQDFASISTGALKYLIWVAAVIVFVLGFLFLLVGFIRLKNPK